MIIRKFKMLWLIIAHSKVIIDLIRLPREAVEAPGITRVSAGNRYSPMPLCFDMVAKFPMLVENYFPQFLGYVVEYCYFTTASLVSTSIFIRRGST
jgi:hypothetical protein